MREDCSREFLYPESMLKAWSCVTKNVASGEELFTEASLVESFETHYPAPGLKQQKKYQHQTKIENQGYIG